MNTVDNTYRLIIACPDKVGIVAAVSQFVADHQGWLLESNYFSDHETGWFFMRNEIRANSLSVDLDEFRRIFAPAAFSPWTQRPSRLARWQPPPYPFDCLS